MEEGQEWREGDKPTNRTAQINHKVGGGRFRSYRVRKLKEAFINVF